MRLQKRALSKVTLINLLRRKKTTLKRYLEENGIVTYELLTSRCDSMGTLAPSEDEFKAAQGASKYEVSSPTEGIVVIQPLPESMTMTQEKSGNVSILSSSVQFSEDEAQPISTSTKVSKDKTSKKKAQSPGT